MSFARRAVQGLAMLAVGVGLVACDARPGQPSDRRALSLGIDPSDRGEPVTASAGKPSGFLMGQLHMHSGRSGDSETPPEVAARWYADRGFDFVFFTDHNVVTDTPDLPGMLTLPGMELTQNLRTCSPPRGAPCLLHVTALFVDPGLGAVSFAQASSLDRGALYGRAVDLVHGWGALSMLNHPNFADAADLEVVLALAERGTFLLEVENRAVDSRNEGGAGRPSTEQLWDDALTRGARVFAVATDDAHHYDDAGAVRARGEIAYVGHRGWVMVRATRSPASIRRALEAGDFYATTGLVLDRVEWRGRRLGVRALGEQVTFEVVGTGGAVLHRAAGPQLEWDVPEEVRGYVRVRARDAAGRRALCQPLFLD
jgi:hypothetical protein